MLYFALPSVCSSQSFFTTCSKVGVNKILSADWNVYIDGYIIDSDDLSGAKKAVRSLSRFLGGVEDDNADFEKLEFLEKVLVEALKCYSCHFDFRISEDAFNQVLVRPYLEIVAKSIKVGNCNADYLEGQPILESMTKQLKQHNLYIDDRSQYKSDVAVARNFGNNDKIKHSCDHHKDMFGTLAMIKTIADEYNYATIDQFTKIKVFFLHAAETHLHFWSLSFKKENVFDLWRESSLALEPDFEDRKDFVLDFVQFWWNVKCIMEKSVADIVVLKEQHDKAKAEHRYSTDQPPTCLNDIINPIILKLTKEDSSGMTGLGPIYI